MEYREGFTYPIKKGCESMNNADKIRSMTYEELVDVYRYVYHCPPGINYITCEKVGSCDDCWLEWLQKPAETSIKDD